MTEDDSELIHIIRLLSRNTDKEICGFLLGTDEFQVVFPVENISNRPKTEFYMDPYGILIAHKLSENLGLNVMGIYHTHIYGPPEPSLKDKDGMKLWPLPWLIVSQKSHQLVYPE
ncbi:MAG: M67 family metallopeptidase [Desulfurococcales archaeon]|nr:M67 family metallopeptidase [Desulfurococcales archaeon]